MNGNAAKIPGLGTFKLRVQGKAKENKTLWMTRLQLTTPTQATTTVVAPRVEMAGWNKN